MILIICDFGPSGKAEFDGVRWSGDDEVFVRLLNLKTVTAEDYIRHPILDKARLMCHMFGGEILEKHGIIELDKANVDPKTVW